ncbi:unnamed protein product [Ambrosiozyma monospora]|uniref:Unnamed protein product n=1 Tax=Ambrosiozyma monospora TaxID=43982 RepID=A0A9W7DK16_AMBMO|nr:unnamed protein product [Ambrosiozyma monospora]
MSSNDHIRNSYQSAAAGPGGPPSANKRNRKFHNNHYMSFHQHHKQQPNPLPYSHQPSINPFSSRRQEKDKNSTVVSSSSSTTSSSTVPTSQQPLQSQNDQFQLHSYSSRANGFQQPNNINGKPIRRGTTNLPSQSSYFRNSGSGGVGPPGAGPPPPPPGSRYSDHYSQMQGYPPSTVEHSPYSHHLHPSHSYGGARRTSNFGSGSGKERYGPYDEMSMNINMNMNRRGDLIMNGSSKDQRYTSAHPKGQTRSISGSGPGGGAVSSARPRGGFRTVSSGSANSDEQQDYIHRSGPPSVTGYGFNSRYGNNNSNSNSANSGNGTDVKKDYQFNNNDASKFSKAIPIPSTHVKSSSISSVSDPKEEEEDLFPDKAQKASSPSVQQQDGQRKENGISSNRSTIITPVKQEQPDSERQSTTEVTDVQNRKELESNTISTDDSKKPADDSLIFEAADSTVIIHPKPTEANPEPIAEYDHLRGISPLNIQHSSSEESTYTPTIGSKS